MSELISEEYRRMQEELHRDPDYGVTSVQYASVVARVLDQVHPAELRDYGAGKVCPEKGVLVKPGGCPDTRSRLFFLFLVLLQSLSLPFKEKQDELCH